MDFKQLQEKCPWFTPHGGCRAQIKLCNANTGMIEYDACEEKECAIAYFLNKVLTPDAEVAHENN